MNIQFMDLEIEETILYKNCEIYHGSDQKSFLKEILKFMIQFLVMILNKVD